MWQAPCVLDSEGLKELLDDGNAAGSAVRRNASISEVNPEEDKDV